MENRKNALLDALEKFIAQKPNLGPANYITWGDNGNGRRAYQADCRKVAKDLEHARTLIKHARGSQITADQILSEATRRLTIRETPQGFEVDFCQCQSFGMEYRAAAASLLSSAFWSYWWSPASTGETLRNTARAVFGRAIERRFFN
jgi:hypothetical protein